MPATYTIDTTRNCAFTKVNGTLTVEDIVGHFETARRQRIQSYKELIDLRNAAPPFLAAQDIWRAALSVRFSGSQEAFGPRAVIVSDDEMFGLARLFVSFLSGCIPMEIFRDPDAAEEWLANWSGAAAVPENRCAAV